MQAHACLLHEILEVVVRPRPDGHPQSLTQDAARLVPIDGSGGQLRRPSHRAGGTAELRAGFAVPRGANGPSLGRRRSSFKTCLASMPDSPPRTACSGDCPALRLAFGEPGPRVAGSPSFHPVSRRAASGVTAGFGFAALVAAADRATLRESRGEGAGMIRHEAQPEPITRSRRPEQVLPSAAATDGAGVQLLRNLGPPLHVRLDPFLLLDEMGQFRRARRATSRVLPTTRTAASRPSPTCSAGGCEHRDSAGNDGAIGAGGVQWMTAGARRGPLRDARSRSRGSCTASSSG